MTRTNFSLLLIGLLAVGCGDDDRPPTDGGSDARIAFDGGPRRDAPMRDGGGGGGDDGNDSFAEAEAFDFGTAGVMGAIQAPDDLDYFSFTATAGQWIVVSTEANPDDDPMMVDTVITLYDSAMTQLAENDDGIPRANTDSEIIYLVPADGTYYVEVQEYSAWAGDPPEGMPSFTYTLSVIEIDPGAPAVTVDMEAGDDAASAQVLNINMNVGFTLGTFNDMTDVDVYSFSVTGGQTFGVNIMPAGTDGYGSTTPPGEMWVTPMAGTEILARIDDSMDDYEDISPALPAGDYLLWVAHPTAAAGANDFYVLKVLTGDENTPEAMDATNGTLAMAETLTQMTNPDTMVTSGFVLAQLGDADVDYYSFTVGDMEDVTVACGSASSGSGVRGLTVEVRNASDTVTATATEMPPEQVVIMDARATPAGTYYLRLSKTGQDPEVTGEWVRCGVHAAVPTTP